MLRREIYAVAALAGAVVVALGEYVKWPKDLVALTGASIIITLRLIALWRKWNAPVARGLES